MDMNSTVDNPLVHEDAVGTRAGRNHWLTVAGLAGWLKFRFIGDLYVSDLIFLLSLAVSAYSNWKPLPRFVRATNFAGLAWMCSLLVADLLANNPLTTVLKGQANIFFLMVTLTAIVQRTGVVPTSLGWYAFMVGLGGIFEVILRPTSLQDVDPWKFGWGRALLLCSLGFVAACNCNRQRVTTCALLGVAAGSVFFGYRSLALIVVVTLVLSSMQPRRRRRRRQGWLKPFFLLVGTVCAVAMLYPVLAKSGRLGSEVRDKYEFQASGRFGYIVGGRTEILFSTRAIVQQPLFGMGSDPHLPLSETVASVLTSYGYRIRGDQRSRIPGDTIPTHSYLFGSWVEAGLLGAVFWLRIAANTMKSWRYFPSLGSAVTLGLFLSVTLLWDVLFSPFGAQQRVMVALTVAIIASAKSFRREQSNSPTTTSDETYTPILRTLSQ